MWPRLVKTGPFAVPGLGDHARCSANLSYLSKCAAQCLVLGPAPADVVEASSDKGHWSAVPMRYQTHTRALFDRVVVVYTVLPVPLPDRKVLACVWF